jgi:glutamate-5-semialdehyde dehydrogenase
MDIPPPSPSAPCDLFAVLRAAGLAQEYLARSRNAERSRVLHRVVAALREGRDEVFEANTLDLEASRERELPPAILAWLKLTPERWQRTLALLESLGDLPDPMRQGSRSGDRVHDAQTFSQLMPLGTIALVYEMLPELGAIAAGMCLKTANSAVLYGSLEAHHTNQAIATAIARGLEDGNFPTAAVSFLSPLADLSFRDLVVQDRYLSLVIPYGRPKLVRQVVQYATVPTLKAALGNCHLYWALSGELDTVRWMLLDSHRNEPDPVNAIEKVLINEQHNQSTLRLLFSSLRTEGFELKGDASLMQDFPELVPVRDDEWHQPYLTRTIAFRRVSGLDEAIRYIGQHSSGHADSIATESYAESHQFSQRVDSASIYVNASPRFQRSVRGSASVFLGMSNQKGYRRGPIGLESLTTLKQAIQGEGPP